jgi:CheY-like chemotaxis protein
MRLTIMKHTPSVLLVDDSKDDVFLMRAAFRKAGFDVPLLAVHGGAEAIAYLKGDHPYSDRVQCPLPGLMLLDLNMPMKNGCDVLSWVRSQPRLKRLSVIVLTSSALPEDIERAYECGASAFLVKPASLEALVTMIRCLRDWMQINHLASVAEGPGSESAGRQRVRAMPS